MTDPTFLLALAAAVLSALSIVLHVVAPRTKTLVDDNLRDDIDEVLGFIRGRNTASLVPPTITRPPQSGRAILPVLFWLAGVGIFVIALLACGARQRAAAGVGAFLDCESAQLPADTLADATALATAEIRHVIAGSGAVDSAALRADMAPLKTSILQCAYTAALAALATQPQAGAARMAGSTVDGAQLRAAFAYARAELGWAPIKPVGAGAPL